LPYMNIPRVLTELHRVLKPKGSLFLSLHSCRFTLRELATIALPKPIPTAYRLYVFGNGLWFHFTGRTLQTERGMRKALTRAGYCDIRFTRTALRFTVEAVRA
jgi:ubiquinone/menaquinone biosynthesis C-methylase UbiE